MTFTVNGIYRYPPYQDSNGVKVINQGGQLVLTTPFGVTITWDGDQTMSTALCDAYAGYICGLCGNGAGKNLNLKNKTMKLSCLFVIFEIH
jgi:hypothetical protein